MVPAEVVAEDWYTYSCPSCTKRPPWAAAEKKMKWRHHRHADLSRLGACTIKLWMYPFYGKWKKHRRTCLTLGGSQAHHYCCATTASAHRRLANTGQSFVNLVNGRAVFWNKPKLVDFENILNSATYCTYGCFLFSLCTAVLETPILTLGSWSQYFHHLFRLSRTL